MAKYEVQVDGSTYEVEGPDDREPSESEVRGLLGGNTDSATALAPENQPQQSNLEGFTSHFGPTALIKRAIDTGKEVFDKDAYKGILDNPIVRNIPLLPVPGASYNGLTGGYKALSKGLDEINNGQYARGAVDAISPLSPLIGGPSSAGLDLYQGKPGAGGEVTGELANLALMGLGKVAPKAAGSLAEAAENSATKSYIKGLNPTKRYLATAEKIAPDLMKQGVWGTVPSLEEAASSGLDKAGAALDAAWQQGGARELPIGGIKQALQQHIQSLSPVGAEPEPLSVSKAAAAQNLIDYLDRVAPEGNVSAEQARSLRQLWDDPVARRNAYMPGADPNLTAGVEAARTGTNALRSTIADIVPEAVEPNKQFKLYSDLQDVLDHRKVGSKGVAATALGTIAGSSLGPLGAIKGGAIAKMLHAAVNSPAWNTFSAVQKAKIARALLGATEGAGALRGSAAEEAAGPTQLPGNIYEGNTGSVLEPGVGLDTPTGLWDTYNGPPAHSYGELAQLLQEPSADELTRFQEPPQASSEQFGGRTGQIFEPGVNPDLGSSQYDIFGGPPEEPLQLATAAQPTLQTRFGNSSSFQLPLESQSLPESVLQEALINELLQQVRRRQ